MSTQYIPQYRIPILLITFLSSLIITTLTAWYSISQVNLLTTSQSTAKQLSQSQPSLSSLHVLETLNQILKSPTLLTPPIPTATLIPQPTIEL